MQKRILTFPLLALVAACSSSRDSSPMVITSTAPKAGSIAAASPAAATTTAKAPAKMYKVDEISYAGVVIFELGSTTADSPLLHPESNQPAARIYVCIDKSNVQKTGNFDVDLTKLGVKPYRGVWVDQNTKKIGQVWEFNNLTVNYQYSGLIAVDEQYAHGMANFDSSGTTPQWSQIVPTAMPARMADTRTTLFKYTVTPTDFAHQTAMTWDFDSVKYYLIESFQRFTQNPDSGGQPVTECEGQNQETIVKTAPDL